MTGRNKILFVFGIIYVVFATSMYFGLKVRVSNKFSKPILDKMILGKSSSRDITTDLCKYQVIGDPKEVGNYVKINILCGGRKASSTLSLSAIEDKTVNGFMGEYARIIGFDEKLFFDSKFACYLDGKLLTNEMLKGNIRPTSTIDCSEKSEL